MPRTTLPIANGFYRTDSLPISSQNCVNLYPVIKKRRALAQETLRGTPGVDWIAVNGITGELFDGTNGGGQEDGGVPGTTPDNGGGGDNPDAGGVDIGDRDTSSIPGGSDFPIECLPYACDAFKSTVIADAGYASAVVWDAASRTAGEGLDFTGNDRNWTLVGNFWEPYSALVETSYDIPTNCTDYVYGDLDVGLFGVQRLTDDEANASTQGLSAAVVIGIEKLSGNGESDLFWFNNLGMNSIVNQVVSLTGDADGQPDSVKLRFSSGTASSGSVLSKTELLPADLYVPGRAQVWSAYIKFVQDGSNEYVELSVWLEDTLVISTNVGATSVVRTEVGVRVGVGPVNRPFSKIIFATATVAGQLTSSQRQNLVKAVNRNFSDYTPPDYC